ncbi:MAG: SusC/RagA family TonB-linked outer membrane protein [Gemmatimonadota bacterium]
MSAPAERRWRRGGVLATLGSAITLLALPATPAAAQNGTITGTVTEASTMRPMSAAQVYLAGTSLGTLTNATGRYLILNVPSGTYTVTVERIGYGTATQEVTVASGGTVEANFALEPEALGLDEIVVTGTAGAARRREVGNSIAQINVADVAETPPSVDGLLQGRVPGMVVLTNSASQGSGAMIRLRGNVSVAMSNQPILYIDGVRVRSDGLARNVPPAGSSLRSNNDIVSPLNDINPADIDRIEVIKGAAATTLYGTEAAAGVIQIFTKRGRTGQAQWTAQIDQGMARTLPFGPDPSTRPPSEPAATEPGGTSDYLFLNPWLRNAHKQKYSLSVSGGGQNLQYFVSGSFNNDEGVLPNDYEKKTVVRGNFTFSPMENLQIQWNTSYTIDELDLTPVGNNAQGITLNAYRRDRNYLRAETREAIDPLLDFEITTQVDHIISGITATWSPTDALSNRISVGYDQIQQNNRNYRPFGFRLQPEGVLSDGRYEYNTITADYVGSYNIQLPGDLRSSLSWGGQAVTTERNETVAYGQDFPGPGDPTVSSGGTTLGFENRTRVVNAGFFVQNLFDINNKYFITAGVRVDGNSAFGENLGLQVYPKVSLSHILSDEAFWNDAWGQMKLRAAWGQSGRAPGAFDKVRTYDPVGWGGVPAFSPDNVGNADIGPERTTELELGFDGSFFDSRLSAEFTWYKQTTSDALFNVRQIPSLGFLSSQLANIGELENVGYELNLNAGLIRSESFSWDLGGSVSVNDSEVLDLGGAPSFSLGDFGWVVEGEPVPVIQADCVTNPDAIAEPIIEQSCNIGPNLPKLILGVNTSLQLPRGMLLTARGEYQGGAYMYDGAAWNAVRRSVRWPGCFDYYRIQETQGRDATTAKQRAMCDVSLSRADYWVYPADFFKIREVTFQTPIPEAWIPGATRASLTLSGHNVWRWVHEDFLTFEPEMGANGGYNDPVRSMLEHVPPPATYTASLRIVF